MLFQWDVRNTLSMSALCIHARAQTFIKTPLDLSETPSLDRGPLSMIAPTRILRTTARINQVHTHLAASAATTHQRFACRTLTMSSQQHDQSRKDGSTNWSSNDGRFRRQESSFRDAIAKDGKFTPELNRYHLITAMACPWAHRAMIVRKLKGLDKVPGLLPLHTVDSFLGPDGWSFVPYNEGDFKGLGIPGTGIKIPGHEDKKRIRELYLAADPHYSARCTVPVIWDNKLNTIVNNESSEIIRMFNTCFDDLIDEKYRGRTYYPEEDKALQKEIDELNAWIYPNINNGACLP